VLDFPQSWSTSNTSTGDGGNPDYVDEFTQTSPVASFIVEEASAFSSLNRSDIIQAEVAGASGGGRTFTQISNPITTVEIAGEQWLRADYLITETDGTKFHMAIFAGHHSQRGYALVLLGPSNTFSQDTSAIFEPILNSLHFTG
jgi:predicted transcriptional regulator